MRKGPEVSGPLRIGSIRMPHVLMICNPACLYSSSLTFLSGHPRLIQRR